MKADDLVNTMRSFMGVREDPPGSNRTPLGVEYGYNGVPWCAIAVSVACARLGFPLREAAVIRIEQHARAGDWGMGWSALPVRGSAVCFDWKGNGNPADMHVGIVDEVLEGPKFWSFEGNYRDRFGHVLRDMTNVRGFATFPFGSESTQVGPTPAPAAQVPSPPPDSVLPVLRQGSTGAFVQQVQSVISRHAGGNIGVDGQFGPQTESRVKDVQRAFHLEVDGVVGPQTWGVIQRLSAGEPLPAVEVPQAQPESRFGDWPSTPKPLIRQGSSGGVVRYLQEVILLKAGGNIGVDGLFGPQTKGRVVQVQSTFNIHRDGIVGPQTWGVIDALARQ